MKKFLSILLTFCLMLTVVAVPLPAIAETSTATVFDFENYSPNRFIGMSGRVATLEEADGNTVIMFNNNGIPYRSSDMDKSNSYTKSGGTYTKAASTDIEAALAADANAYSNYYHTTAQMTDFKSTTKNEVTYDATTGKKGISFNTMEAYNAIELGTLEASTTYRITVNYKRESLVNALYVQPVTWDQEANWRYTMYVDDNYERITIPTGSDDGWQTVSTFVTTPADLVNASKNNDNTNGNASENGNVLRLILFTGVQDANNVVYFDNITVEEVTFADLTYNYANGNTNVVEDLEVGSTIDYVDLAANKLGDNYGKWYTDAQGTTEAPATLPEGGLTVYEVVRTGLFDFENHYARTTNMTTASSARLSFTTDDTKKVVKFENTADAAKNPETGEITSTNNYQGIGGMDRYNSIGIGEVAAGASKTYRVTVALKREAGGLPIKLQAWTCAYQLNFANTRRLYDSITVPAATEADSDYVEYSFSFTTDADHVVQQSNQNEAANKANGLFLYVGTGKAGDCVAYFDYIKVEEFKSANLTYHYADGTTNVVENLEVGTTIDYVDLAANRLGENNGVWYGNAEGTVAAPTTMVEGGVDVYEVVKTGVFDFNNYYNYADYTGTGEGFAVDRSSAIEVADGVLKYDSSKSAYSTNDTTGQNRVNSIAIGEAKENTTYKITVYYKRGASTNAIVFRPMTGMKTVTAAATKVHYDSVSLSATETADSEYQKAEIIVTTAETFAENSTYGGTSNCFYLTVATKVDGKTKNVATLDIDKITVEEVVGSVTYVIPEGATVNGVSGSVTVAYTANDAITFPEVVYADGYSFNAWTDAAGAVVTAPTLGGTYTLVVNEPVEMVTITLNRGGETEEIEVEKGSEYTLPDTQFTDTSWWNNETASSKARFVGYEGEKVVVNADVTYYTSETYSYGQDKDLGYKADQSVYRTWTGIDTTTEDFSYFYKTETSDVSSSWTYNGGTRVCTRLGVVEDGKTYRISVTYKATTDADIDFHMLTTTLNNSGGTMRNYLESGKTFHVVEAGTDTNGWTTATFYITADLPAKVTESTNGLDDTKDFEGFVGLYLTLGKAEGSHNVDLAIKETKVEDLGKVITTKGASVLKDEKVVNGVQAMRYYFDYATAGDGTTITIGGTDYTVKERGFLYTNGAISHYAKYNENEDYLGYYSYDAGNTTYGYAQSHFMMWLAKAKVPSGAGKLTYKGISGDALANNWALDNGTVTFSTYVTGISTDDYDAKMMVRGYVIFADENGVEHTVYSETTNRSVQGIINALVDRHE